MQNGNQKLRWASPPVPDAPGGGVAAGAHASRTAAVADRALADRPQLRELLGLLERS